MSPNFRVSFSDKVRTQFIDVMNTARSEGKIDAAIAAMEYIHIELKLDPLSFGESREDYPEAGLAMRIAFVDSIQVWFAVHSESRNVFIRSFSWLNRP